MTPELSVVVPSHGREARLRTLLDALEDQTLPRERWELIVVHTYPPDAASGLFEGRAVTPIEADPARARPSIQRNAGWRAARGERIAFVDDDCRPTPEWLERLLAESRANPGAVVQGAVLPDPREAHLGDRHAHVWTLRIDPPSGRTETANILYERALLERLGGFDERAVTGEDMDLGIRAQDAGAHVVGAPDALVYHAVDVLSAREKIRAQVKWQHLAYVVKKNPRLREECEWRVWWKPEHSRATLALAALVAARRRPWLIVGAIPYAQLERRRHGLGKRRQLRAISEVPTRFVVEIAEVATFVRGSVRYRTILL
ncbi:MAG TPA: glycosyltransferase [Thermoleophilaceae bacterium]|jgi:glycosyltransferase involved in cell wall biosynthesis